MTLPPLQLDFYVFPIVDIKANPDWKATKKKLTLEVDTSPHLYCNKENNLSWKISLKIETNLKLPSSQPYFLNILCDGFFSIDKSFPSDKRESLIAVTGTSILYSAARELILLITGRCPWGPAFLPTISFLDVNKFLKQKDIAQTTPKRAKRHVTKK